MKLNFLTRRIAAVDRQFKTGSRRAVGGAGWLTALVCAGTGLAQPSSSPPSPAPTPAPTAGTDSGGGTNVTKLEPTVVVGKLNEAREQIVPSLGATAYPVSLDQIQCDAQGENAGFNQVLLRTPGMAQESLG